MKDTVKTQSTRTGSTIRLINSLRPYHGQMILTVISAFLKHIAVITAAALTSYSVALAMTGSFREHAKPIVIVVVLLVILRAVMYYSEMLFGHNVAYKVIRDFRIRVYDKLEELSPAYLVRHHSGQIGATLMGDIELLEWFLAHTFGSFITAFLVTIVILIMLSLIHPVLALMMLMFSIAVMLTPFIFRKDADVQGAAIRRDLAELNALSVEGVQGLREIITMNNKQRYLDKYRAAMQNLYSSQITYGKRQGRESMLMYMLIGSFSVALMLITASLVNKGVLEFSVYPVVLTLSALLFAPLIEVCAYSRNLGNVFAAADRIQGVFDEKPEVEDLGELSIEKSQGHAICFENVSFSYAEGLPEVLHNISFEIKPGQTVALAGHSGAGKTTCANLLLRYWEPLSGHVFIDDKELSSLSLSSFRSCTAAVLQDVYLFNMSIMDNIRLGAPDASDEEVYDAARRAYIDEFIKGLPDGYNTVVGERGSRFSGGQRQRIAIARALLKDPPILILDEAVSNLDAESELYIQKALREHSDGRTTLVIAHRLSTLSAADKIVLLDHGRVVGEGSHDELLAGNSYYRDLLKTQQDEYE